MNSPTTKPFEISKERERGSLSRHNQKTPKDKVLAEQEIISPRSSHLYRRDLFTNAAKALEDISQLSHEIADELLRAVLNELVKGGELFSFDPGLRTAMYDQILNSS